MTSQSALLSTKMCWTTNGPLASGAISAAGEVDEYEFEVASFETYRIETSGSSDTVISLYAENDPSNQIAFNDDGGVGLKSLISINLSAGRYIVRVRLYSAGAAGNYGISLTSPAAAPVTPALIVNGGDVSAVISAASESDLFQFGAQTAGNYVIETRGFTDTYLTLFGPNSQSAQIAQNDDSGFGLNARISWQLAPGQYFLRVRHYSPWRTGTYRVGVRQF